MKKIITFYSYKGGVGRSMALANIAVLFARRGCKVLMIDWDLEAPGLENFFGGENNYIQVEEVKKKKGLVEVLVGEESAEIRQKKWREYVIPIHIPDTATPLYLLSAGQRNENNYFDKVRQFDVNEFYREKNGGEFIENLRKEWLAEYDYVFVDSRTGVTDIGGICTIQLPDILVLLFTPTEQSFKGIIDIALRATKAQQTLPYYRERLACLPVPTRFDALSEFKLSQTWLDIFAKDLAPIYELWLPANVNRRRLLENTKVPYSSYFSFGEKLPVIEQGINDPAGLGYAYANIANMLLDDLDIKEPLEMQNAKLSNIEMIGKIDLRALSVGEQYEQKKFNKLRPTLESYLNENQTVKFFEALENSSSYKYDKTAFKQLKTEFTNGNLQPSFYMKLQSFFQSMKDYYREV
jgi:MinD-like ATPase involved in chromosome partitioning or flagellar assembly